MGIYINIKCPKCNFSFTKGDHKTGVESNLGLPLIKCPNCGTVLKTGRKIYSMMNSSEKKKYIFSRIGQTMINALAISIGLIVLVNIFSDSSIEKSIIFVVIVAIIISSFISYLNDKGLIDKLEKIYKEKNKDYYADID